VKRLGKFLWKVLKWLGANLPFFLVVGAAIWAGVFLHDRESMHFFIILGAFYIVFREQYETRELLKKATSDESEGRHHGSGI
jgi:hypothetical protein